MDLSKAKTIFITVFIALNIFLFVNIGVLQKNNAITQNTLDNTVSILAARGVTFAAGAEIPVFKEDMPLVVFEDKQLDKQKIMAGLKAEGFKAVKFDGEAEEGIQTTDESGAEDEFGAEDESEATDESGAEDEFEVTEEFGAEEVLEFGKQISKEAYSDGSRRLTFYGAHSFVYTDAGTFLKVSDNPDDSAKDIEKRLVKMIDSIGLRGKDFVADISEYNLDSSNINKSDSIFTFVQKQGDFLIFDNFVEFTLGEGGIKRIVCCFRPVKGYESKEEILPAHQILINSLNDCSGCEISSIKMGYKGKGHTSDEPGAERQAPVWLISFSDGSRRYYRAYDGAEM